MVVLLLAVAVVVVAVFGSLDTPSPAMAGGG